MTLARWLLHGYLYNKDVAMGTRKKFFFFNNNQFIIDCKGASRFLDGWLAGLIFLLSSKLLNLT